ncbi:unnamed protein product [Didymodactylos carnosus]|uniref:Uncharacterized protein n=1 Tax=Didymodactylos carnosus TaxID=1234261 RepID=A0A8S2PPM3_9BILA|nr:unnamed protein product [Didymodactylos carnosus]CAF4057471.1 unnamed protein product [Didymodactylos carnosus]
MDVKLTEIVDTKTKHNKEKPNVFNGKKEFQILENSLEIGDDHSKIEESCEKLIKNSKCLLEFNYKVKSLKQFLLEVVPEIANLDIINELLAKDKLRSCKIFKQLFEIINKKENFFKYFELYQNTTIITTTDHIATISFISNDDEENSTSNNNNNEEKDLSICQYYESIFNVIITVANHALLSNDMYESTDLNNLKQH